MAATMAGPTWLVASTARGRRGRSGSDSRRRVMFSRTTVELSSTTPTATTSPPREKMLSENPSNRISAKLTIRIVGRTATITNTCRRLPRKR